MITAIENNIEKLRARLHGSQVGAFLRWWLAELSELLPERLKAGMQHARRRVVMSLHGDEIALSSFDGQNLQELEVTSLLPDTQLQMSQLNDLLVERELDEVSRDLVLNEDRVLRKTVVLPVAAEANLRQALAFEMDRQTPFKAEDVFFDYRLLSRDKEVGLLRLELLVTPKPALLKEIQALESIGMAPSGVDVRVDGLPAGLNLLPHAMRRKIVNRKARFNLALAGITLVLLALVMAQSLWLRQHQLEEVQTAIDNVRTEAMQVQALRERIADAGEAAGFLTERRNAAVPTVAILDEVTRIMPDDTFLDRLLIDADSVQMQGKSQNAQQLIELVNASELFEDASFRGPTRLDSRTQREMFDINASIVVGGAQ